MSLVEELFNKESLNSNDIEKILNDSSFDEELFYYANLKRKICVGDGIHLKALIEISNICSRHCKYCGLRSENKVIKRYKIDLENIKKVVERILNNGYKTVVLQSGESNAFKIDEICELIKFVKSFGLQITLSFGEKTYEELKAYKEAGANRYLLRIETKDENLYSFLHPKMSLENRVQTLKNLQKLGYETGSGLIIGVPNQNNKIIANDLLWLKQNDFDMAGIGPFIPAPNTPFELENKGGFTLATKVMAILRLLLPYINIPATTAMENLQKDGRMTALNRGANVIMPNFTTPNEKKLYQIYPKNLIDDSDLNSKLLSYNRYVSKENGDSKRFIKRH